MLAEEFAGAVNADLENCALVLQGTSKEGRSVVAAESILEFEGVTAKEYDAVNNELGLDPHSGKGDWPAGLVAHSAGLNNAGNLVVTEVWDTPEHQAAFMGERLGAALAKAGITGGPSSITWIELLSHRHLGS